MKLYTIRKGFTGIWLLYIIPEHKRFYSIQTFLTWEDAVGFMNYHYAWNYLYKFQNTNYELHQNPNQDC